MKKNLLFLAMAAVALASCSNDETTEVNQSLADANAISFRTNLNNATRATSLALSSLETNGFYVTATYVSGHTLYFGNQLFKLNSAIWKPYDTSASAFKTIYWPSTGADILDFHAYAPNNAQLVVSNENVATLNGCPEYTVTPAAAAASQVDFIYATLTGQDYENTSMALTFNHKESQVSIKLKNSDSGLNFTVDEVAVCNIAQSGVFKYRTSTMAWGDLGSVTNYVQGSLAFSQNGVQDAAAAGVSWILIPQALASPTTDGKYVSNEDQAVYDGSYIRVKMRVQSAANTDVYYAGSSSTWVNAIWPISGTWAAGTHYTYTVDLSGGGYYEKNPNSGDDDLVRVLNLTPITFATVTVSDWSTSNSDVALP
jgi:hypothetical protein